MLDEEILSDLQYFMDRYKKNPNPKTYKILMIYMQTIIDVMGEDDVI